MYLFTNPSILIQFPYLILGIKSARVSIIQPQYYLLFRLLRSNKIKIGCMRILFYKKYFSYYNLGHPNICMFTECKTSASLIKIENLTLHAHLHNPSTSTMSNSVHELIVWVWGVWNTSQW